MSKKKEQPVAITSPDVRKEILGKLKAIYPPLFSDEGNLDKGELDALLKGFDMSDIAKFEFRWAGKMGSKKTSFTPSKARLQADPKRSVDFDDTQNVIIEGENLEVLKLLQKSYYGKVKCIYIDPPYNTGHDFVYSDDYSEEKKAYWEQSGTVSEGVQIDTNAETEGRYHSNWLNMMQSRLLISRQLLREDGVIFLSIGNDEVHNLRKLLDEIFGEENFIECIVWNKRVPKNDKGIGSIHEYILIYAKDGSLNHQFKVGKGGIEEVESLLKKLKKQGSPIQEAEDQIRKLYEKRGYDRGITLYNALDKEYRLWGKINMSWPNADTFGPRYEVLHPKTGKVVKVPDRGWRWKKDTFDEAAGIKNGKYQNIEKLQDGSFLCGKIWFDKNEKTQPSSVTYLDEVSSFLLRSIISLKSDGGVELEEIFEGKSIFSYPKPTELLKTLVGSIGESRGSIILDFFAGSGTTSHAVMELNKDGGDRKFILVQIPELNDPKSEAYKAGYKTISEITIERTLRAGKKIKAEKPKVDVGFKVFKLTTSLFPENLFVPDPKKSKKENLEALDEHIAKSKQKLLVDFDKGDLLYEAMLKDGFELNFKAERLADFAKNEVLKVSDGSKEALVCLDQTLQDATVKALEAHKDSRFICLHRAVDTTKKWGLDKIFGDSLSLI